MAFSINSKPMRGKPLRPNLNNPAISVTRIMGGTPGVLPFALWVSLRLLNFLPDKIVHGPIRSPGTLPESTGAVLFKPASCRRIKP
jgi:hypothetical protein